MRIELWLLLLGGLVIANIYTEGRYLKQLYKWKKYYQMVGVVLGTLFLYFLIKKNPMQTADILQASNDYLKYLPLDKNSASFISPILDFTRRQNLYRGTVQAGSMGAAAYPVARFPPGASSGPPAAPAPTTKFVQVGQTTATETGGRGARLMNSGKGSTKRSVSETKKKFVASRQNWRCGHCNNQLSAWFEVDHKIRLEYGGDNHIDNLVALCRECHGEKTAMENL